MNKIIVQIGKDTIELKGAELEAFLEQQAKDQLEYLEREKLFEAENEAKQQTLQSAIAKLSKLGLTEDEAKAIIGIQ